MPLAKIEAQAALRELEHQGWETLPIAILGMPNLPPAWAVETWKPIGGCKFTGYFSGVAGNSALRFCLLLKWRAIRPQATELFTAQLQGDSLSCVPAEFDDTDVETASTPSSDTSAKRAERLAQAIESDSTQGSQAPDPRPCTPCPQQLSPPLFAPWSQVAQLRGVVAVHTDIEACPHEELQVALEHLGGGALEGEVPPHFHCTCPPVGESQVYGRYSSPLMSLLIKNGGLPMAGRPVCMKSPPSLRSHRIRAKNGSSRVWQGSPSVPTNTTCVASSQAAPCSSTAAAPGLSQWLLVEASFAPATTTSCPLASAWVSAADEQATPPILL